MRPALADSVRTPSVRWRIDAESLKTSGLSRNFRPVGGTVDGPEALRAQFEEMQEAFRKHAGRLPDTVRKAFHENVAKCAISHF